MVVEKEVISWGTEMDISLNCGSENDNSVQISADWCRDSWNTMWNIEM